MKSTYKYIIGFIVIILGVLLIFHKQVARLVYDDTTPKITAQSVKKAKSRQPKIDDSGVKPLNSYDIIANKMKNRPIDYIGLLSVPSIGLKEPIINELSDYSLTMGAAITNDNLEMGERNFVLASHFSYVSPYMLFSPLYYNVDQGAQGQLIYTTDMEYVYTYKTSIYKVVDNSDTKYIQDDFGDNLITLYTCYYYNESGKVIMQGELQSKKSIDLYSQDEIEKIFFK